MTSMTMFYDTTNTLFMTSHLLSMTSHPLFRTSHQFMYDIKSNVSDLTSIVSVSSDPPYWWHHSHYMDGITYSISVKSYPLYIWHYIHRIHSFTPNQIIYDVTSISGMTLHPLYQILHPLYLCHHNLSTDITPTLEWHHTHLLCDIICTI